MKTSEALHPLDTVIASQRKLFVAAQTSRLAIITVTQTSGCLALVTSSESNMKFFLFLRQCVNRVRI